MKKHLIFFTFLLPAFFVVSILKAVPGSHAPEKYKKINDAPLLFMENKGQVKYTNGKSDPDVLFMSHNNGINIYLLANSISYQFIKDTYLQGDLALDKGDNESRHKLQNSVKETYRFAVNLVGANPHPLIRKEGKNIYTENYYLSKSVNGASALSYEKVVYKDIYPHIDWVVYSHNGALKYDFIVKKGGNPANIRLRISDAGNTSITAKGALLIKTDIGEVRERRPVSYSNGKEIPTSFLQHQDGTIGFKVQFKNNQTLIIDPEVVWATYYGNCTDGGGISCTTDDSGNVYLSGKTGCFSGIASGGYQNALSGDEDAFLVKFNAAGTRLWATYYGGPSATQASGSAVDKNGNVYLTGFTNCTSGISSGGFQNACGGGYDAFLVKLNGSGERLWATYYGGGSDDYSAGCTTDSAGNVYMAGRTSSPAGIAAEGFQNTIGSPLDYDAFLVKFDSTGARLWGTYYGGAGSDNGTTCTTDKNGNIYLGGFTTSSSGISYAGFQDTYGGGFFGDAFLVKFSTTGARLWATYFGSSGSDAAGACATDTSGNVFLTGNTSSLSGLSYDGFQSVNNGGDDAFVVKFNASGARIWSTFYGGSNNEEPSGCATDLNGNVYVAGSTNSSSGLYYGGFQDTLGGGIDAFIVKFSKTGTRLWASYYGGPADDRPAGCNVDLTGNLYLSGTTESLSGIATVGSFQDAILGGVQSSFLLKIDHFINTGNITPVSYCPNATISIPFSVSGTFDSGNIFTAQLSNASGAFTSVVNIGMVSDTVGDTIMALLPAGLPAGAGYRIRIISSSPVDTGADNGADIYIHSAYSANLSDSICLGQSYLLGSTVCTVTGVYVDTFATVSGCDSIITLHLFVSPDSCSPAGIQNGAIPSLGIYPNPVINQFTITSQSANSLHLSIYSPEGQLINDEKGVYLNGRVIDTKKWSKGIYLLYISDEKGYYTTYKILKE